MSAKRPSHLAGILFAGAALGCAGWSAVPLPSSPIRTACQARRSRLSAGGPTDIMARAIADKLSAFSSSRS